MDEDAGPKADLVTLRVPVGLVGDGYAVPSVRVDSSQALSYAADDSLGKDVGLYCGLEGWDGEDLPPGSSDGDWHQDNRSSLPAP